MSHRNFSFCQFTWRFVVVFLIEMTAGCVLIATPVFADETSSSTIDNGITASLTVRYQDQIIFDGRVSVSTSTKFTYQNGLENATGTTGVTALAVLINADAASENFSLNKIDYFPSYGSYIISCLLLINNTDACNNWQYTINSSYPAMGADQQSIVAGDQVYFYFGDRHQIEISTTTLFVGETVMGTINEYDYKTNEYEALPNTVLGLLDTNDAAIITATTDVFGVANFTLTSTGTYHLGMRVASDWGAYYWPKSVDFIVNELVPIVDMPTTTADISSSTVATSTTELPPETPVNPGGGNFSPLYKIMDLEKALGFLSTQQIDGYFSSNLLTDWSAIAFSLFDTNTTTDMIKQYLLTNTGTAGGLNSVSNDARRAMALMALGINPYTGTSENYIKKIANTFDGRQFISNTSTDQNLYNDDIFALMVLMKAGYTGADPMIDADLKYILSKQKTDGSFDGIDLTAAAIQTLELLSGAVSVDTAIKNAKNYLQARQNADGSFPGSSPEITTAWCVQALNGNPDAVNRGNNFLFTKQATDGGLSGDNDIFSRVWTTAFAIPAALGKSWGMIMKRFDKTVEQVNNDATKILTTPTAEPTTTTTPPTTTNNIEIESGTVATTTIEEIITTPTEITATESPMPITKKISAIRTDIEIKNEPIISQNTDMIDQNIIQLNELPLDTPTRKTAKRIMEISGGGTIALGLYLGLRFLRSVL